MLNPVEFLKSQAEEFRKSSERSERQIKAEQESMARSIAQAEAYEAAVEKLEKDS